VELIGEDDFFVGFAVVVAVFVDEEHVVWLGVTGLPVRVAGHGGDPEAALVVEGELDGVGEFGEFFLGGEEVDLVAGSGAEGGEGFFSVKVFGGAVLFTGFVVGFDFGELLGSGIGGGKIEGFSLGGGPDGAVAVGAHLFEFFELGGVVFGSVGAMAFSVDVDAVGDLVVFFPEPVFFADGVCSSRVKGAGEAARIPKNVEMQLFRDGVVWVRVNTFSVVKLVWGGVSDSGIFE